MNHWQSKLKCQIDLPMVLSLEVFEGRGWEGVGRKGSNVVKITCQLIRLHGSMVSARLFDHDHGQQLGLVEQTCRSGGTG